MCSAPHGGVGVHCWISATVLFSSGACMAAGGGSPNRRPSMHGPLSGLWGRRGMLRPIMCTGPTPVVRAMRTRTVRGQEAMHVQLVAESGLQHRPAGAGGCPWGSPAAPVAPGRYPSLPVHADSRRTKSALTASEGGFEGQLDLDLPLKLHPRFSPSDFARQLLHLPYSKNNISLFENSICIKFCILLQ